MAIRFNPPFLLGSSSPRRKRLLKDAGIHVEKILSPDFDEDLSLSHFNDSITSLLGHNCRGKLTSIMEATDKKSEDYTILVADTVVFCDGKILGKPADFSDASRMLKRLSGRVHEVYTYYILYNTKTGRRVSENIQTRVEFFQLGKKDIEIYASLDEPYDKAGAYAIQGKAGRFVKKIHGSYSNVVGLPVGEVLESARKISRMSYA